MNAEYIFPRNEGTHLNTEGLSRSSSIQSMDGTLLYKLNRQNRKVRNKTMSGEKAIVINKPQSRLLIREKVQWSDRRRLMT
jgi:hypothetical protein